MRAWKRIVTAGLAMGLSLTLSVESYGQQASPEEEGKAYLGFDRNEYPGDGAMAELRKQFVFVGYWLSPPPGGSTNEWKGKREKLATEGYGFVLLYAGRPEDSLKKTQAATAAGDADAAKAAKQAKSEGFDAGWTIFLDIEEGGRFSEVRHAYFRAWAAALVREHYRPGFYCSGMAIHEEGGTTVISAGDIRAHLGEIDAAYWVFNDMCPPSPGCVNPKEVPTPATSGVAYATLWQITRSPKESTAKNCGGYAKDKSCYAAVDTARKWFLDLDVATSANPSAPK